jgi:uncharacterized membrane protein YvbJ
MAFCPRCGAYHDPNYPCADRAGEMMQDMGVEKRSKMSKEQFEKLRKTTDRLMFRVLLIALGVFILLILLIFVRERFF